MMFKIVVLSIAEEEDVIEGQALGQMDSVLEKGSAVEPNIDSATASPELGELLWLLLEALSQAWKWVHKTCLTDLL